MCDQTQVTYNPGDIVWVKLSNIWWPAEVQDESKLSEEITAGLKKKPLAVVKFFDENKYDFPKNFAQIYNYNCFRKDEFVMKGYELYRAAAAKANRNIPSSIEKFPEDVVIAEGITNGDPKYIDFLNALKFAPPEVTKKETSDETPAKKIKIDENESSPFTKVTASFKTPSPRVTFNMPNASSKGLSPKNSRKLSIVGTPHSILKKNKRHELKFNSGSDMYHCIVCEKFSTRHLDIIGLHMKQHYMGELVERTPVIPRRYLEVYELNVSQRSFESPEPPQVESPVKKRKKVEEVSKKKKSDPIGRDKKSVNISPSMKPISTKEPGNTGSAKKRAKRTKLDEVESEALEILKDWDEFSEDETVPSSETKQESYSTLDIKSSIVEPTVEKSPAKSCFDFEDNEDSLNVDHALKFGQKLPRVINEKQSSHRLRGSSKVEDNQDDLSKEVDNFLETVSTPQLPSLPQLIPVDEKKGVLSEKKSESLFVISPDKKSDKISVLKKNSITSKQSSTTEEILKETSENEKPLKKKKFDINIPDLESSIAHLDHSPVNKNKMLLSDKSLKSPEESANLEARRRSSRLMSTEGDKKIESEHYVKEKRKEKTVVDKFPTEDGEKKDSGQSLKEKIKDSEQSLGQLPREQMKDSENSLGQSPKEKIKDSEHPLEQSLNEKIKDSENSLGQSPKEKITDSEHPLGQSLNEKIKDTEHSNRQSLKEKIKDSEHSLVERVKDKTPSEKLISILEDKKKDPDHSLKEQRKEKTSSEKLISILEDKKKDSNPFLKEKIKDKTPSERVISTEGDKKKEKIRNAEQSLKEKIKDSERTLIKEKTPSERLISTEGNKKKGFEPSLIEKIQEKTTSERLTTEEKRKDSDHSPKEKVKEKLPSERLHSVDSDKKKEKIKDSEQTFKEKKNDLKQPLSDKIEEKTVSKKQFPEKENTVNVLSECLATKVDSIPSKIITNFENDSSSVEKFKASSNSGQENAGINQDLGLSYKDSLEASKSERTSKVPENKNRSDHFLSPAYVKMKPPDKHGKSSKCGEIRESDSSKTVSSSENKSRDRSDRKPKYKNSDYDKETNELRSSKTVVKPDGSKKNDSPHRSKRNFSESSHREKRLKIDPETSQNKSKYDSEKRRKNETEKHSDKDKKTSKHETEKVEKSGRRESERHRSKDKKSSEKHYKSSKHNRAKEKLKEPKSSESDKVVTPKKLKADNSEKLLKPGKEKIKKELKLLEQQYKTDIKQQGPSVPNKIESEHLKSLKSSVHEDTKKIQEGEPVKCSSSSSELFTTDSTKQLAEKHKSCDNLPDAHSDILPKTVNGSNNSSSIPKDSYSTPVLLKQDDLDHGLGPTSGKGLSNTYLSEDSKTVLEEPSVVGEKLIYSTPLTSSGTLSCNSSSITSYKPTYTEDLSMLPDSKEHLNRQPPKNLSTYSDGTRTDFPSCSSGLNQPTTYPLNSIDYSSVQTSDHRHGSMEQHSKQVLLSEANKILTSDKSLSLPTISGVATYQEILSGQISSSKPILPTVEGDPKLLLPEQPSPNLVPETSGSASSTELLSSLSDESKEITDAIPISELPSNQEKFLKKVETMPSDIDCTSEKSNRLDQFDITSMPIEIKPPPSNEICYEICLGPGLEAFKTEPGARLYNVYVRRKGEFFPGKIDRVKDTFTIEYDANNMNNSSSGINKKPFPVYKPNIEPRTNSECETSDPTELKPVPSSSKENINNCNKEIRASLCRSLLPPSVNSVKQSVTVASKSSTAQSKDIVAIPNNPLSYNIIASTGSGKHQTVFKKCKLIGLSSKPGLVTKSKSVAVRLSHSLISDQKVMSNEIVAVKNSGNLILDNSEVKASQKPVVLRDLKALTLNALAYSGKTRIQYNISKPGNPINISPLASASSQKKSSLPVSQTDRKVLTSSKSVHTGIKLHHKSPNILQKSPKKPQRLGNVNKAKSNTQDTSIPSSKSGTAIVQSVSAAPESIIYLAVDQDGNYHPATPTVSLPISSNITKNSVLVSNTAPKLVCLQNAKGILKPSGQDILAEALANTQVLQSDLSDIDGTPFSNTQLTPTTLTNNVLETSLTLNQPPIMSPLEVPSAVNSQTSLPILTTDTPTLLISNPSGFLAPLVVTQNDSSMQGDQKFIIAEIQEQPKAQDQSDKEGNMLPEFPTGDFTKKTSHHRKSFDDR